MNICMVLPGHDFPPDIRVEKEAEALKGAGHNLFVACEQTEGRPLCEEWKGITIRRRRRIAIPFLAEKYNGIPGWMKFLDSQWAVFLDRIVQEHKIQAIHTHDLPKAGASIAVGRKWGLPVVLDLHENFPGSMETYIDGWTSWKHIIASTLIRPRKWQIYEKEQVMAADYVINVVKEAANRILQLGVSYGKITIIENTEPIVEEYETIPVDKGIQNQYSGEFVVLYVGGFGGRGDHRGLTTAVKAMPEVLNQLPNTRLLLVGKGSIRKILNQMIQERSIEDRVTFVDWIPQQAIRSYIAVSSVCLIPYNLTPNTEASCPNKLFQYMSMGKPVVVSSCESLKRYIAETGAGMVFQAGDERDLARTIVRLKEKRTRDLIGKRGYDSVRTRYNWGETAKLLIELYKTMPRNQMLRSFEI